MLDKFGALLLALLVLAPLNGLAASDAVVVTQKKRSFSQRDVVVRPGGAVHFTNEDGFPHQLHVTGPGMDVDSDLQAPGETIIVPFPAAGTFNVRCAIHPRMQSTVRVE